MATTPDRMQIPEYVKRELSQVYLLMDHIAGRKHKTLDEALAPPTVGGRPITLEELCGVAWPPTEQDRAKILALVLTAKDRLSCAAYPASAFSVAFTHLSVARYLDATRGSLRQLLFGSFSRRLARRANRLGSVVPTEPSDEGDPSAVGGSGDDVAGATVLNTSAMVQLAKDAFPGLEVARESPFDKLPKLFWTLVILLVVTCFVSWDLAVGQRLLADYHWLSINPQVLLRSESDEKKGQCPPIVDPKVAPQAAPKVDPGGPCARYLAGQRVVPLARNWNGRQKIVRWFIHDGAIQERSVGEASYQGYVLEQTRVLVTTLNYNVLPLLLGGLAATAAAIRSIATKLAAHELEPRDLAQVRPRVLLGAFLGAMIGLFISPGPSNGLFALPASPETTSPLALSPAAFAFLAGFATNRIFHWLDNLIERAFAFANPKP